MGEPLLREVATRRCMAPADLNITLRLVELSGAFGARIRAQYARSVSMAEIRNGCAVLLGSRRSNPWGQLFEPRLNFVLGVDPSSGAPRFDNQAPKPGEPNLFGIPWRLDIEGTERTEMESYALIALVPSLSRGDYVLILEGLSMEATEAAGETVTNVEKLTDLQHQIGHRAGRPVQPFEALIRLTTVPGGYVNPKLASFRYPLDSIGS